MAIIAWVRHFRLFLQRDAGRQLLLCVFVKRCFCLGWQFRSYLYDSIRIIYKELYFSVLDFNGYDIILLWM